MSQTRTYIPSEVTMIFGPHIITGFTQGTFIDIGLTNPASTTTA